MDNSFDEPPSPKKISISGKNNRYQIKKLTKEHIQIKKRAESKKWEFSEEYFSYENQLKLIKSLLKIYGSVSSSIDNECLINDENELNTVKKIMVQQINKKIYGYKQQDMLKKHFEEEKFVTFEKILQKLVDCDLKCYFCKKEMDVLYDIMREMTQWSIDRIDNEKGHNVDNCNLSCLDCNLKKRRRSDDKFLFTKQLNLLKTE
jgi:hypothetical protein